MHALHGRPRKDMAERVKKRHGRKLHVCERQVNVNLLNICELLRLSILTFRSLGGNTLLFLYTSLYVLFFFIAILYQNCVHVNWVLKLGQTNIGVKIPPDLVTLNHQKWWT